MRLATLFALLAAAVTSALTSGGKEATKRLQVCGPSAPLTAARPASRPAPRPPLAHSSRIGRRASPLQLAAPSWSTRRPRLASETFEVA